MILLIGSTSLVACEPPTGSSSGCRRAGSFLALPANTGSDPRVVEAAPLPKPRPKPKPKKRIFNCSKQTSPQWTKLKTHRGSVRSNGKSGSNARYYEWDNTHNDIEVYGPAPGYSHLGSMDPVNGNMYKGPVKGRNLRGKLK